MFGFICSLRMMGKVKLKDKVGKLGEGRRKGLKEKLTGGKSKEEQSQT